MPRKPNTELRRQQIVEALGKVIARSGYEQATTQAIAAQAGLAPGLIHYHFSNKREILVALVNALAGYARARFAARAARASSSAERLRAYLDARLAYGDDANPNAVAAWVVIGAEAIRDEQVRAVYQEAIGEEIILLRSLLKARFAEQGKRVRKLDHLVAGVLAFSEGAFALASNARALFPSGYAAELATQWIERYIAAEPPLTKPKRKKPGERA